MDCYEMMNRAIAQDDPRDVLAAIGAGADPMTPRYYSFDTIPAALSDRRRFEGVNRPQMFVSAWHAAVFREALAAARAMVEGGGVDVNSPDVIGQSAMHVAAEYGLLRSVELLWALGADVNAADAEGRTPLERAARARHQSEEGAAVIMFLEAAGAGGR